MLPTIASHASKHGIKPKKRYGQNFLYDSSLCQKIVGFSGLAEGEDVLEIGPGTAGLTRAILEQQPAKLTVIEMDERCMLLLQDIKELYPNLEIKMGDALKVALADITAKKLKIIANLPYNVGTALLTNWLAQHSYVEDMTLMLQREVVDRICAKPGSKAYGRLSIICQICAHCEKLFDVSPKAFFPAPKIWSSIVKVTPKPDIPSRQIIANLERLTHLAFSGRRKMLKSSLKNYSENIDELLTICQINPELRAENLSPDEYLRLAMTV